MAMPVGRAGQELMKTAFMSIYKMSHQPFVMMGEAEKESIEVSVPWAPLGQGPRAVGAT